MMSAEDDIESLLLHSFAGFEDKLETALLQKTGIGCDDLESLFSQYKGRQLSMFLKECNQHRISTKEIRKAKIELTQKVDRHIAFKRKEYEQNLIESLSSKSLNDFRKIVSSDFVEREKTGRDNRKSMWCQYKKQQLKAFADNCKKLKIPANEIISSQKTLTKRINRHITGKFNELDQIVIERLSSETVNQFEKKMELIISFGELNGQDAFQSRCSQEKEDLLNIFDKDCKEHQLPTATVAKARRQLNMKLESHITATTESRDQNALQGLCTESENQFKKNLETILSVGEKSKQETIEIICRRLKGDQLKIFDENCKQVQQRTTEVAKAQLDLDTKMECHIVSILKLREQKLTEKLDERKKNIVEEYKRAFDDIGKFKDRYHKNIERRLIAREEDYCKINIVESMVANHMDECRKLLQEEYQQMKIRNPRKHLPWLRIITKAGTFLFDAIKETVEE